MTMYLVAALAGVAAWFYALYQRSLKQRAEVALAQANKELVQAQADEAAQRARYEAVVADLKVQLKSMEDSLNAYATPDAVRARFRELFARPSGAPGAAAGLPDGSPAPAAAASGFGVR